MAEEAKAQQLPDKEDKSGAQAAPDFRAQNLEYMKSLEPELDESAYDEYIASKLIPKLENYGKADENLKAMMNAEPELSQILMDMGKGAPFLKALPRYVDVQNLDLQEGDADYEEWAANNHFRKQKYKQDMDRRSQLENNQRKSQDTINKFFEERQMDGDMRNQYATFVGESLDRAYEGELTPEFLNKMYHAWKYEDDVKLAEESGAVKGRNEQIVAKKIAAEPNGDGLPVITGGVATIDESPDDNANDLVKSLRKITTRKSIL